MVALGGLMLIDVFLPSFVSDLTWPFALIGFGALLILQWSRRKATTLRLLIPPICSSNESKRCALDERTPLVTTV